MAHLTGLTSEELEARLNEAGEGNEEATISQLIRENYTAKIAEARAEGVKRGVKEKAKAIEKAAAPLFEKHGIEPGDVEAGLGTLAEKLQGDPGKPGGELTADALRVHPIYKQVFQEDAAALRDRVAKAEARATAVEEQAAKSEKLAKLKPALLERLKKAGAQFGVGEESALNTYLTITPPERFHIEGDEVLVLDEQGERMKDELLNPVRADDFLAKTWVFGFEADKTRHTPSPPARGGNPTVKFDNDKAFSEAYQARLNAGDREGAKALREAFLKQ